MELKLDERKVDVQEKKINTSSLRPAAIAFPQSPPSSTSSPTHDFEFTISFCPSGGPDHLRKLPSEASFDIELNPADDLFYQGHLLPLHHTVLFPTPRTSCSCSTPTYHSTPRPEAGDVSYHEPETNRVAVAAQDNIMDKQSPTSCNTGITDRPTTGGDSLEQTMKTNFDQTRTDSGSRANKPKSFSLLTLKKGSKLGLKSAKEVIERYIVKMVKPFFMRKSKEAEDARRGSLNSDRQRWNRPNSSHSFSKQRYSRSSAPCSTIPSPGNSGVLCAIPSTSNESTMEDLQNAIQAAISHCKNSINAVKEEGKIDQL